MSEFDRRIYQRGSHFYTVANISSDGQSWQPAEVYDVSSGGLKLHTGLEFHAGDILWLDMTLHGFFSEFEVKTQCVVRRKLTDDDKHVYGLSFKDLSQDIKIRIDENVIKDRPVSQDPYMP